jgi:hypothetical protein
MSEKTPLPATSTNESLAAGSLDLSLPCAAVYKRQPERETKAPAGFWQGTSAHNAFALARCRWRHPNQTTRYWEIVNWVSSQPCLPYSFSAYEQQSKFLSPANKWRM